MGEYELRKTLDKAVQLAEIASDWNLDEVEIDGEMVSIYDLNNEFKTALAALSALEDVPQPDWAQAPDWAQWWTCDPAGWTCWFQEEPLMYLTDNYSGWVVKTINGYAQGLELEAQAIDLPLGIDWRLLKVRRPQESDQTN